ncbi:MAG: TRAP transporter small permease [Planctomycetes bacterium]|nr:TRAP transporter small permease [Planctomycetota bacterium]
MRTADRIISKFENYVCVVTFSVMLALTFANALSRYGSRFSLIYFGFSVSMSFTEEIVTNLFVIASLAGSTIAFREHAHLGLDFVTVSFPVKIRKTLFIFANILGILFCLFLFREGVFSAHSQYRYGQVSTTMQWPEWIYGSTVPFGAAMLLVRFVMIIIKSLQGNWAGVLGCGRSSGAKEEAS